MAGLATVGRGYVRGRLASGGRAVMAGEASARHLRVIHVGCRLPAAGVVAVGAQRARGDVRDILAGGNSTVVAGGTSTGHLRVIHAAGRFERRGYMATLAGIAGRDVRGVLANCSRTIVTTETVGRNAIVAEVRRLPCGWRVAAAAIRSCSDMADILARCGGAVMAGCATTRDLRVIHPGGWLPRSRSMTALAGHTRQDMRGILASRTHTVVTTRATAGDAGVIEPGRLPGQCAVTGLAAIG